MKRHMLGNHFLESLNYYMILGIILEQVWLSCQ